MYTNTNLVLRFDKIKKKLFGNTEYVEKITFVESWNYICNEIIFWSWDIQLRKINAIGKVFPDWEIVYIE